MAEVYLVEAQTLDGLSGSPVFLHEIVEIGVPHAEFDKELDEFLDRLEDKPAANTNDGSDMRRRMRKPSIHKMIADAEKSGKTVTRFTTPDGATLTFGEPGAVDTAADDLDRELADFQERHRGRH
jgi:hypothetical protein